MVVAILPARIGSTRLPRKMLANVDGKPLVVHTWERVRLAGLDAAFVATDDEGIATVIEHEGGEVIRTGACPNGSARVAQAAFLLGLRADDVVLNVQGDEPLVEPEALRSIAAGVGGPFGIATGAAPLPDEEAGNPSRVKVSCGRDGAAIEFSRRPLVAPGHHRVHVGVYAFRNDVLQRIVTLPEHPDEVAERLEQLRWLRAGEAIRVVPVNAPAPAVDTPEDLERVRAILASNAERG